MKPTFLVVMDLSAATYRAAHFAALLATAAGGRLVLLPLEKPLMPGPEMDVLAVPPEYYAQEQRNAAAAMTALARQLPAPTVVERSVFDLYEVLDELIDRWQPQLLVLALAPEHDVLDHLLLNEGLPALRDAGLPLLLVPAGAAPSPRLPRLVAIAADGEGFQLTAASLALRPVLSSWAAAYCVVYAASSAAPDAEGLDQAEAAVAHSGLLPGAAHCLTYRVAHQSRSAGIVQAALDVQADILVLPARPRSLLASVFGCGVAAQVVRASPLPVLLLPTTEVPMAVPARRGPAAALATGIC